MVRSARWFGAAVALFAALPARAQVAPVPLPGAEVGIVVAPGIQSEPALSKTPSSFVAYTDYSRTPSQVWYCRMDGLVCSAFQAPASSGSQFTPATAGDALVYVDEGRYGPTKGNVVRVSFTQSYSSPVSPFDALQARPAVSDRLVAWEDQRDPSNGKDIWVHDNLLGGDWSITGPGTQRSPRVSGTLVAYLDDAVGNVKIYDIASGTTTVAYSQPAAFADVDGTAVAVATQAGDVEVHSVDGRLLAALPLPGLQGNPHISGDWVAFEDSSTTVSRVIVWNWRAGGLYAPPAGTSSQTLNDISWPRVVYVDDRNPATAPDIYLFDTSAPDGGTDGGPDAGPDGGSPARCDDPSAVSLAALQVLRDQAGPDASNVEFAVAETVPVLVCIDASEVSSAWLLLDDEAVARPNDFNQNVVHVERRRTVPAGLNRLGALVAGRPGAVLAVRVLPDPGGGPAPMVGAALKQPASGTAALASGPAMGCSAGAAGLVAALPLGVWLLRRRRREA